MKSLVLVLLAVISLATAKQHLLKDAEPLLKTLEELPHFLEKIHEELPLKFVLGHPDAEGLDLVEKQIKLLIGQHVRNYFEKFLKKIESLGHQAEESYTKLFASLEGKPTAEKAEKFLSELLALEDEKKMLIEVLEDLFGDGEKLKEMTLYAGDSRQFDLGNTLDRIISWFTGLGTWISDSLDVFKQWAKDIFVKTMDTAKPITDQIKILAQDFLQNNWDTLSVTLVKQALSFFHPYAGMLGGKIVEKLLELAKSKGLAPWTDVTMSSVLFLK